MSGSQVTYFPMCRVADKLQVRWTDRNIVKLGIYPRRSEMSSLNNDREGSVLTLSSFRSLRRVTQACMTGEGDIPRIHACILALNSNRSLRCFRVYDLQGYHKSGLFEPSDICITGSHNDYRNVGNTRRSPRRPSYPCGTPSCTFCK